MSEKDQARKMAGKYRKLAEQAVKLEMHNEAHRLTGTAVELETEAQRAEDQGQ